MSRPCRSIPALCGFLLAVGWGAIAGQDAVSAQDAELLATEAAVGFDLGAEDADLVVVEYADFACSACASFAGNTWPELEARYVETGRVRWRMIPFELGFRNSEEGARAARCAAAEGAFGAVHDALYAEREAWVDERDPGEELRRIAVAAGVDRRRFDACYDGDVMDDAMEAANEAAERRGVRGTPTFFVDGVPLQGALPLGAFVQVLERALSTRAPR